MLVHPSIAASAVLGDLRGGPKKSNFWGMVMVPHASAGELLASDALRLQHLCDAVLVLEAVRDDSGIARMVPDSARCI